MSFTTLDKLITSICLCHEAVCTGQGLWCFAAGKITTGLTESNGSLPPGLWLRSPAGWLARTRISSGPLHFVRYRIIFTFFIVQDSNYLGISWLIHNNNNNYDDIYSAVVMTEVIARVHSVHLVNVEQRQAAADPRTKPPDLGCESASFRQLSSTTTIAIYYYYSAQKLILIYRPTEGRRLSWPRHCRKGAHRPCPRL